MAIAFRGTSIPGTHETLKVESWQIKKAQSSPFGLDGTTQLVGGKKQRKIRVAIWIYNSYVAWVNLEALVATLEGYVEDGLAGDLVETGTMARTFSNVVLERIQRKGPGSGPFLSPQLGWMLDCIFEFTQLAP